MTLLGFDFGPRKIGIAVGQTLTATASPLTTLRARGQRPDWNGIEALIHEWSPDALVVGLPRNMDDSETHLVPRIRRFAHRLEGRFRLPVHLVDERLTTLEARRLMGRRTRAREGVDAVAAQLILETWLRGH